MNYKRSVLIIWHWVWGLLKACIEGGASGGLLIIADPQHFNLTEQHGALVNAIKVYVIVRALTHLSAHPLPDLDIETDTEQEPQPKPNPVKTILPLIAICFALLMQGCATVPQTPPGSSAGQTFLDTVKSLDGQANDILADPFVQAGAEPAGAILTGAALWSYQMSGGSDVADLAGAICAWCNAAYSVLGGQPVTPEQVNDLGKVFSSSLNASDPKFAKAFGPVQQNFDRMILKVGGTPGLARDTLVKFVKGVQMAASNFITGT